MSGRFPGVFTCAPRPRQPFSLGWGGTRPGLRTCEWPGWSGAFPVLPSSHGTLVEALGTDGSVSVDLTASAASHIWQCGAVPMPDEGTLAAAAFDYVSPGAPVPTITTDPGFRGGSGSVMRFGGAVSEQLTRTSGSKVPNAMDGTLSVLSLGVMQWDSLASSSGWACIRTQYNKILTRGWTLFAANAGVGERKLRAQYISGPGFTLTDVECTIAVPYGAPFAYLLNIDFAAAKLKITTSHGGYNETPLLGNGDFDHGGIAATLGYDANYPGVGPEGFTGLGAQYADLEYSAGVDAEISDLNMTNFLQKGDGF